MNQRMAVGAPLAAPGWRPKLGFLLLILALVSPLLVPLVVASDLPREQRAALTGLMLFGVPMALIVAVIGLVGQPAYRYIRGLFSGDEPPPIGVGRYRVGLVLLSASVLVSWLEPLVAPHFPGMEARRVLVGGLTDAMTLVSLFILGGEFWDKVHALFVHDARVLSEHPGVSTYSLVRVGWRFYAGAALIACIFLGWLLVPAASAAGWSTAQVASLTGGLFIANKVLLLAAIAVMGKDGFNYLKLLVSRFLRKFAPAQKVSRSRYQLGLVLFAVPVLMTWVAPYVTRLLRPDSVFGFLQSISLEILLLVGLFLLGGEFWDKLRALFRPQARVEIPRGGRG